MAAVVKLAILTEEMVSQTTLKGFLDENAQVGRFHLPVLYVHGSGHCLRQPISVRFANELHQKKYRGTSGMGFRTDTRAVR